jgi:hypothetical protein
VGTKKLSLKGIVKECKNCKRTLSGRCFVYNQHSPDKYRDYCRTCDSYKPKGYPTLAAVIEIELALQRIFEDGKYLVADPLKDRIKFESFVYHEMERQGLLDTWKPPVWLHKTSLRHKHHDHQVPKQ